MAIDRLSLPTHFYFTSTDLVPEIQERLKKEARARQGPTFMSYRVSHIPVFLFVFLFIAVPLGALFLFGNHTTQQDYNIVSHPYWLGAAFFLFVSLLGGTIAALIRTTRSPFRAYCAVTSSFLYQTLRNSIVVYPLCYVDDVHVTHHYHNGSYLWSKITLFIGNQKKKMNMQSLTPEQSALFANLILQNSNLMHRKKVQGLPYSTTAEEQWIWQSLEKARLAHRDFSWLKTPFYGILLGILASPAIYLGANAYDKRIEKRLFQNCQSDLLDLQEHGYRSAYDCYDYLENLPKGFYATEIENLLWSSLKQPRNKQAFHRYGTIHSTSKNAPQPQEGADEQKQLFDQQKQLEEYLRRLPNGLYTKEVRTLLAQVEDQVFTIAKESKDLAKYQTAFPQGRYLEQFPKIKDELFGKALQQLETQIPKPFRISRFDSEENRQKKIIWHLFKFLQKNQTRSLPFVLTEKESSWSELPPFFVSMDIGEVEKSISQFAEPLVKNGLKQLLPYEVLEPIQVEALEPNTAGLLITYHAEFGNKVFSKTASIAEAIRQANMEHKDLPPIPFHAEIPSSVPLYYQEIVFHWEIKIQVPGKLSQTLRFDSTPPVLFFPQKLPKDTTYSEMARSALQNLAPSLKTTLGLTFPSSDENSPALEQD